MTRFFDEKQQQSVYAYSELVGFAPSTFFGLTKIIVGHFRIGIGSSQMNV